MLESKNYNSRKMSVKYLILSLILIFLSNFITTIKACFHKIDISKNDSYVLRSPNYPYQYDHGSSCRYKISAPEGYGLDVECNIAIKFHRLYGCTTEHFLISDTDDPDFRHGQYFCGKQTIQKSSRFQTITIGYVSFNNCSNAETGIFECYFTSYPQPCDCGWSKDTKIVGGHEAKVNQYPFMAGIVNRERGVFCGGSIISHRFTLTAAHCVFNLDPTSLAVLVGDHDLNTGEDSEYSKLVPVKNIIPHENYIESSYLFDIALLRTSSLTWSLGVGPICLPFLYTFADFSDLEVEIVGWDTVEFARQKSGVLLEAKTKVISNQDCHQTDSILCTYSPGTDTCQGDSGGPVVLNRRRMFNIGIISSGYLCDGLSYNTRVTTFLNWISEKTNENFCKRDL